MSSRSSMGPGLKTAALSSCLTPFSPYSDSPWPHSAIVGKSDLSFSSRNNHLLVPVIGKAVQGSDSIVPSPVAPSPINSETTEFADVDDVDASEDQNSGPKSLFSVPIQKSLPLTPNPALKLDIEKLGDETRQSKSDDDEPPASVIYAPAGFGEFRRSIAPHAVNTKEPACGPDSNVEDATEQVQLPDRSVSDESFASACTVSKQRVPETETGDSFYDVPPTPLRTEIPLAHNSWTQTPRAQTRQDLGAFSRPGSALSSIVENEDHHSKDPPAQKSKAAVNVITFFRDTDDDINTLTQALNECWRLCNTLASLSNAQRERAFNFARDGIVHQRVWKSCWALCQHLYVSKSQGHVSDSRVTLERCREFCQALFDVRARDNETADSALRVSFELNNHLFNMHDRTLPEAFRERTLDFYITLCHRLMKQKTRLADEPDNLLKACWTLAEMLFTLRHSRREERRSDEETLSSTVQACWNLCDLFKQSWSSIHPDSRQTPRPSQTTFTQAFQQARQAGSTIDESGNLKMNAETPTTMIDESTTESPCEAPTPNLVVLGSSASQSTSSMGIHGNNDDHGVKDTAHVASRQTTYKWPHANTLSTLAAVPLLASATSRPAEDTALILLKSMFVRAALLTNRGFVPSSSPMNPASGGHQTSSLARSQLTSLPLFVKSLPESTFGTQTWQMNLLDQYRRTIINDETFYKLGGATDVRLILPASNPTTAARVQEDIARAVRGMVAATSGWSWLKDMYRFCFGVYIEEVLDKHNVAGDSSTAEDLCYDSGQDERSDVTSATITTVIPTNATNVERPEEKGRQLVPKIVTIQDRHDSGSGGSSGSGSGGSVGSNSGNTASNRGEKRSLSRNAGSS